MAIIGSNHPLPEAVVNSSEQAPLAGAVHCHHTEWPPLLFPGSTYELWTGSPASKLAPMLVPSTVAEEPVITVALAKLSLTGAAVATVSRTSPGLAEPKLLLTLTE